MIHSFKNKLLESCPSAFLRENKEWLFSLVPEFKECDGFNQHTQWHQYDVLEHIFHVVDATEPQLVMRLAALFHDVGKPFVFFIDEKGIGHAYGHEQKSLEIWQRVMDSFEITDQEKEEISWIIARHMDAIPVTKHSLLRRIRKHGMERMKTWIEFHQADVMGMSEFSQKQNEPLIKAVNEYMKEIEIFQQRFPVTQLCVNGEDCKELGACEGRRIGEILQKLKEEVEAGTLENERETCRKRIVSILKERR